MACNLPKLNVFQLLDGGIHGNYVALEVDEKTHRSLLVKTPLSHHLVAAIVGAVELRQLAQTVHFHELLHELLAAVEVDRHVGHTFTSARRPVVAHIGDTGFGLRRCPESENHILLSSVLLQRHGAVGIRHLQLRGVVTHAAIGRLIIASRSEDQQSCKRHKCEQCFLHQNVKISSTFGGLTVSRHPSGHALCRVSACWRTLAPKLLLMLFLSFFACKITAISPTDQNHAV